MEVTTRNTDDLNAVMTVKITESDYKEKVDKTLKDYRRKANIPGFRPGHVPAGLIRKQYGKSVMIDEINHLLQHAIVDHLQEEKLDILGNPLPVEQNDIDWDNSKEFSFEYELGMAPDFELKINQKIKVPYYKIAADKEMVDRYVSDYAKRFGKMTYPDQVEKDGIIRADFKEVDKKDQPVEGGIEASATLNMDALDEKKGQKGFLGKKKGDTVVIDATKVFKGEFNLANLLEVEAEQLAASTQRFALTLTEVSKLEGAPLDQELFDKVFGAGEVKSEEEFRARIKADAEKMFVGQSDNKFYGDVKTTLLGKMKFDLPESFLKKWMRTAGEEPMSQEEVDEKFPEMKEDMRWQLIENKIIKESNIEVSNDEVIDYTKNLVMQQMAQYGQMPEQADLEGIAKNVLQNKEEERRITDQLYSEKLIGYYKENLKLDEKEVTFDQFIKKMS